MQEAFVALFRGIGSFRGDARFSTWLYRVLMNTCISRRRRAFRREEQTDFTAEHAHPPAGERHGDALLRDLLQQEIARLPGTQRAVFLLCASEGMTHQEAADVLNIRVGTSKSCYHRAKATLKNRLRQHGIETPEASA